MISKQQRKQLKGYLRPQEVHYGNGKNDWAIRTSMSQTIIRTMKTNPVSDKIEDLVMEVYMYCMENDKFYPPASFIREVKTRYIRWYRTENGLTQRGTIPKSGKRFHVHNVYDEFGDNIIENIADPDSFEEEVLYEI